MAALTGRENITVNPNAVTTQLDIVEEIILDHNNVRDLFTRYIQSTDVNEKQAIANTFIREIVVHSGAEMVTLYQSMDQLNLKPLADHSREEHEEIEQALLELGTTSIQDQAVHDQRLKRAMLLFQTHGDEEESDVLLKLQTQLTLETSNKLALEFLNVRQQLSQMPPPSNVQVTPLAQKLIMLLQERQSMGFVELRFQHPANSVAGKSLKFDMSLLA
ncbi:hypothetical protein CPB86DRAFT_280130 [Serendipita vermifera]|nr:hypothetical protein CPB86DRAFT_280130 [Serendipita vermifera]